MMIRMTMIGMVDTTKMLDDGNNEMDGGDGDDVSQNAITTTGATGTDSDAHEEGGN